MLPFLHRVALNGWVYDLIQKAVGAPAVRKRLQFYLHQCSPDARVLDVGGGTGAIGELLPQNCVYYCLDLERPKLLRYMHKTCRPRPILADAHLIPVTTGSIDVVVCAAVAHHLTTEALGSVFTEIVRVMKPEGKLILFDPVEDTQRWVSRFLWSLDRGSYPRTPEILRSCVESRFSVHHWEELVGYHKYVLGIGSR